MAIANFSLTFAKAILVFCIVLFSLIAKTNVETDGVKPKIDYMLTMEWPGALSYDIDIWISDPAGNILFYGKPSSGFMTLERDDLGREHNEIFDGKVVKGMTAHEEIVAFRGAIPGEYIVNVHFFGGSAKGFSAYNAKVEPFNVNVKLMKINPNVTIGFDKTITLEELGEEKHVTRFTLTDKGDITSVSSALPVSITERVRGVKEE